MNKVILAYAIEDTKIADSILKEKNRKGLKLETERYPILDNTFWNAVSNESIDSEKILIICSQSFCLKYELELNNYVLNKGVGKYSFALIAIDEETNSFFDSCPSYINILHYYSDNTEPCTQILEFMSALQIVQEREKKNDDKAKSSIRSRTNLIASLFFSFIVGVLLILLWLFSNNLPFKMIAETLIIIFAALALILNIVELFRLLHFKAKQKEKQNEQNELNEFKKELDSSLSQPATNEGLEINATSFLDREVTRSNYKEMDSFIGVDDYSLIGHLKFNLGQMEKYYIISRKQAEKSFKWAIRLCVIGFLVIIFAVLSPVIFAALSMFVPISQFSSDNNALIPVIGTIGGAVVEIISGTIFFVYKKSLSQMNLYHKSLSKYQDYLNCVNLIVKLSKVEKQDEIYEKIILAEINKTDEFSSEEIEKIRKLINKKEKAES